MARALLFPILMLALACAAPVGAAATTDAAPAASAAALSPTSSPLSPTVQATLAKGFDEKRPISIQGHTVHFNQTEETLLAEGDVVLQSADTEVHAERLWYDMKEGTLRAEGKVVVADPTGNTLWAERLAMNQVSHTGQAEDLVYSKLPWTAACGGADILSADVVVLHGCECTSCRQENPMWRISARTLKMKANDKLWAWGVWLYTGRVPVFYLPYFSRSLKDSRPPIEIKPGYTSALGAYVRLGYNYFLDDGQYGTVRYDWMQKWGEGWGLGEHYRLWGGEGSAAGYYTANQWDPSQNAFSGNLSDKHVLGKGLTLMANLDVLSNPGFNETYDIDQVDTYQQRAFISLQSAQKSYSWSVQASQTRVLQTIPTVNAGGSAGTPLTSTVISQEALPSISYSLYQRPLFKDSKINWGFDAVAQRNLIAPQVLQIVSGTSETVYDPAENFFMNGITLTPSITDTLTLRRGLALSSTGNLNLGWVRPDNVDGWGSLLAGYGSFFNLQERPRLGVTIDLGWRYQRQLDPVDGALWSGEGVNQFEGRLQDQVTEKLSLLLLESYDLRPWQTDNDLKRLSLARLQSTWAPDGDHSANVSASYHVPTGAFKTVDASLNANDHKKLWRLNLGLDWVNNAIVATNPAVDPTAPTELNYQDPRVLPDQLFASARTSLSLGPKWKISYYEQLDLVNRRPNEQAYTVDRDFSCIDLQLYAHENTSVGWQYGFAISLDSVPGVKIDSNQVTSDLFNPAQYGY